MSVELQWEKDGVYRKFTGRVSESEVQESNQRIARDRRFATLKWNIADFLQAEVDDDSPGSFYDAVARHDALMAAQRRRAHELRTAAIAADRRTIAHLRFFDSLKLPPHPFGLFETVNQARAWIAGHPPNEMR